MERLESILLQHGATVYARIDQQAELERVGKHILPLVFILFGNPQGGGTIIVENPLAALDLPLKLIAWEDQQHKVWVAYNNFTYIAMRYKLSPRVIPFLHLDKMVKEVLNE
ncbi:DUF302 domain-containing protein [Spirosoma spitsbergense]|uniref:DUF302 domain-containing protein n=1 Tax=Spirosoma spitsbergense TaxID=431554 RepID=UPI0003A7CEEA|nr:DUF302 domain-containing protein [Spirosoma spitsbergense]